MKVIEHKIRSLYHSTVFLWLVSAFFHIFSFFWVRLCRHFVCFSPVSRPRTQILSLFILAAILNKFPLSVDKSVTWFLLCARVFSPAAAILESEKTLGTRLWFSKLFYSLNPWDFGEQTFSIVVPGFDNYLEKGPVEFSKSSAEYTSSETQGRSVGSRKTKTKVFKNGWESPWDATFDEQVPRFIRMLSNWPAQSIVLL